MIRVVEITEKNYHILAAVEIWHINRARLARKHKDKEQEAWHLAHASAIAERFQEYEEML